jgi:DNA-binding response OmpR family regulator
VSTTSTSTKYLGKKALVVEDNEAMLELFAMTLRDMGFAVTTAVDGLVALSIAANDVFDVTICDIQMPRLSGISFVRNSRVHHPDALGRIIFVSAVDDTEVTRQLESLGALAFLVKPVTLQKLRETLAEVMSRKAD